jgi:phage/plasmid-associated DNA primase
MQMEMQMREAEAKIGDLEAQMGLKQAQAMLAMTKAKSAEGAEELEGAKLSVQYQMEVAKLQAKLTEAREEMAMKVRIATIHSSAKREGGMLSNATKSFGTELQTRVALTKIAADVAASSTSGT